jgi:hypothetical protein
MPDPGSSPTRIDPRGPRFAATLTTLVLAAVLLTAPSATATTLLVVQAALFAAGALGGIQRTPYAWLFKRFVRPRLAPPTELEDAAPPRFAQTVGLVFALVALSGFLTGVTALGLVATGLALAAAFLNAAFGFCLGCEIYLLVRRALPNRGARPTTDNATTTGAGAVSVATER